LKRGVAVAIGAALGALAATPARAGWQFDAGPSVRQVVHTEFDAGGHRIVRESGWLPGVALGAAYGSGALTWSAGVDASRGGIGYAGRTQAGLAVTSTTSTTLSAWRLRASWALADAIRLAAAIETDRWRRDIGATAGSAGLQESTASHRLLAGAAHDWQSAAGRLTLDGGVLLSTPERLRVGFSGLYDRAAFAGERARGLRAGLALRPATAPWLALALRFERTRTPRSADIPLTSSGQFRGTIAQPEHVRQAVTLSLSAFY